MRELAGKVAVVAGVGNLGIALARRFAREGMRVVLADIDPEALAESESALRAEGATILAVPTDVSQLDEVQALADRTLGAFGAVHVLCNNVGANPRSRNLWEATDSEWRWIVDANLWGTVHAIRVFVPIMLAQDTEGHIVNTSTIPGFGSRAGNSPYVVTKAAVITLTEVLHHELTQLGAKVRASVLVPGRISGGIAKSQRPARYRVPGDEQRIEEEQRRYESRLRERQTEPGNAFVAPEEVAVQVCDAIRSGRFYILTHPEPTVMQVRARADAVATDGVPPLFHG